MRNPKSKELVAIVTGGATGIGREVVRQLAELGLAVVVNYHESEDAARRLDAELREQSRQTLPIRADVTDSREVDAMVEKTLAVFGRIDVLVNNAGGSPCRSPLTDLTRDAWDTTLLLNLTAPFLCCKAVLGHLDRGAAIINMSSSSAFTGGSGGSVHYAAAKAGLIAFTKGLASEVAQRGIRVNAVAPGGIDTPFHSKVAPATPIEEWPQSIPLSRLGTPRDVADLVVFLATPSSSFITGQTFHVNGGLLMV